MHRYAILRLRKITSGKGLNDAIAHNLRQKDVPNADPSLPVYELYGSNTDPMDLARKILNQHPPRSYKSPCGIEVLMSVSREWASTHFADTGQWARLSNEWLETTFGKDSVLSCALHLDETTPHMHAIVMPVVDKHIDVRPWMDGPDKLSELQSIYAKAVEDLGLVR
jgi:hypothetical protein